MKSPFNRNGVGLKKQILMKMEEVVTAYETYPEVIEKYNKLVEADGGRTTTTSSEVDTPTTEG